MRRLPAHHAERRRPRTRAHGRSGGSATRISPAVRRRAGECARVPFADVGTAEDRERHDRRSSSRTSSPPAGRNGGTVSVIGVYAEFVDEFPMGTVMNGSHTIEPGQCHVHRYSGRFSTWSSEASSIGRWSSRITCPSRMPERVRHRPEQEGRQREGGARGLSCRDFRPPPDGWPPSPFVY